MGIEVISLTPGSRFTVDGEEFSLVKISGNGSFNWLDANGCVRLSQDYFAPTGRASIAMLEKMKQSLIR